MSPRARTDFCTGCSGPLSDETRRANKCIECTRAYYREWSKTDKARAKQKRSSEKYRLTEHGKRRRKSANLMCDYGIGIEVYEEMIERQNGECAICGKNFVEFSLKACVDHCHESGTVRGILCQPCNVGLGWFRDNQEALANAVEYLNIHGGVAA